MTPLRLASERRAGAVWPVRIFAHSSRRGCSRTFNRSQRSNFRIAPAFRRFSADVFRQFVRLCTATTVSPFRFFAASICVALDQAAVATWEEPSHVSGIPWFPSPQAFARPQIKLLLRAHNRMPRFDLNQVKRRIETCVKLLDTLSFNLSAIQEKVLKAWIPMIGEGFNFLEDLELQRHNELVQVLAREFQSYQGTAVIEKVYVVWYGSVSTTIKENKDDLSPEVLQSISQLGKTLAAIFILHCEFQRAITCLNDIHALEPENSLPRIAMMRLAAEIGEWHLLAHLLKREETLPPPGVARHEPFVKLYQLMLKVHEQDNSITSEQIAEATKMFHPQKINDFLVCEGSVLELRIRIMASRLAHADLRLIGDPIANREKEFAKRFLILKSRTKSAFFNFEEPCSLLRKFSYPEEILKVSLATASVFESLRSICNEYTDAGMLKDAQSHSLHYLAYAVRSGIPIHVVRASALLTKGYEYVDSDTPRYNRAKQILETVLAMNQVHEESCSCAAVCSLVKASAVFALEHHHAYLVYEGHNSTSLQAFCSSWHATCSPFDEMNRQMRKRFFNPAKFAGVYSYQQVEYFVGAVVRMAVESSKVGAHIIRRSLRCALRHGVQLRSDWLMLHAHFQEAVKKLGIDPKRSPSEYFKAFGHLLLRDWRPKICSIVGGSTEDPHERAFYFSEAFLCGLRQSVRAKKIDEEIAQPYLDVDEFKEDLNQLPADITVVQLFVDPEETLWLTRLQAYQDPYTVKLKSLKGDKILYKLKAIREENIESTKLKPSTAFWSKRKELNARLEKIVAAVEKKWFGAQLQELLGTLDKMTTVVFSVSPVLTHIPFESMPFFQRHPLVCRTLSFRMFCRLLQRTDEVPKPVNCKKSYYILNPGGDLHDTEARVKNELFSYGFEGITGVAPDHKKIKEVLSNYDVLLYIGHGSGGRYFGRSTIRQSNCNAVSVLMGCSSVQVYSEGNGFDGRSTVYDYMVARCPCVIGCLWLVTDGEIDKFLVALLDYCYAHLKTKELEEVLSTRAGYRAFLRGISEARKACRLPYLTGSSVVAYGLPIVSKIY
ncbi:hypothetical protein L596_029011 [Steinernema carpocapsae]|uniref:separase n=1 Tax=Steinernema carpocapsae TaxID=34508 RepID=A0A4U5LTC9_STECR|nr:hypothetical protein L596_029011 [Steinernema carpocapsae]